ncbi:iron chaperone [Spirochaeta thermophila]|uniref:Uncharacterized protein n=1 Tax=Winmispira thermophila (strain ATCC 49972 / DSM 6192 / RI 19.B1) TaxID=665571 RepID=E0RSX8_WINT6|nr:DUF1801 domain-containing protein [Spirochaeta thermophila]ADN02115.1 hypothetical protein STHERM_c11740 [Spirochaeta thermophila DSM 6192]
MAVDRGPGESSKDAARTRKKGRGAGEEEVRAKIAEMGEPDRTMAERLHRLILEEAPMLTPKTWYGMPAYAREGKVVCFFQSGQKFKTRYATLGFTDVATLDEGSMWPTAFALAGWNPEVEARVRALIRKAVGTAT